MAEPLKAIYHEAFIRSFADKVKGAYPPFDTGAFSSAVLGPGWDELELKGRMRRITLSLGATLPSDYGKALAILEAIYETCGGLPYLFFPDFVEIYGLNDWDLSIAALAKFTRMSTSEFAVRPFLKQDQSRMIAQMLTWSGDEDDHVRRLASEGCRPRLPWADALPALKRDPEPILPILERLKSDPSEYVRRSVANNLNDISKDHPERVVALAQAWIGDNAHTDWVLRHGCRGLLKAAHPAVMALFGMAPPAGVTVESWTVTPDAVAIGDSVRFRYAIRLPQGEPIKLRIEMAAYFVRTTGKYYRKLFKLSEKTVGGGTLQQGGREFSFADLSTRRHYPGSHRLALVVNGQELASADVMLRASERGGEDRP
ncbi:DNA alkylation repair protein [Cohnella yongneupensis]|uniref:DNA alkylation repair protein n=1 Tax=Cohnella yongneupensis TaxID=425006 RepID=A0ABW0R2Q2_9BACL